MGQRIRDFFTISPQTLPEFWRVSHQRNRVSLLVICIMIFGMELFNMARVLFWTTSGLGTLNNQIYFSLYASLFISAAVYLLLNTACRGRSLRFYLLIQYGAVLFFLLWHVCMNVYDLIRNADAEVGIYFTAVLGLSVFILMPAKLSIFMHAVAYILLMALAGSILSSGDKINITFTTIVALAVSLTNSHHHATMIAQRLEINRVNTKLQFLAQRDALTGLLNKAVFKHCVEPHLQTEGTTLLIADLDNFKGVNDQYGHPCGDFVLKEAALRIEAAFPDAIGISRIGGDEFGILIAKTSAEDLAAVAQALTCAISAITWHEHSVGAGCSIGACQIGPSGATYEQLYREADRALYQAKGRGRGQFSFYRLP